MSCLISLATILLSISLAVYQSHNNETSNIAAARFPISGSIPESTPAPHPPPTFPGADWVYFC